MIQFLLVVQIIAATMLISLILLQKGESGLGGLGGGGSGNMGVFSVRAAGSLLTKMTMGAAIVFMAVSLALVVVTKKQMAPQSNSILDQVPIEKKAE